MNPYYDTDHIFLVRHNGITLVKLECIENLVHSFKVTF